jgi:hypothetical protein
MKLTSTTNEVILSNVGTTGEFKIRNSAKAFKILSDGLYSNKIRAIIRELSCNAVDSHVGAGKSEVPFEVHLPSILEPWFAVKDFGMGLDGNQVVNIYTTYFESTKTDSNAFIGALGLGSKSPFSYTENFTVTAIKDGMKRIYSAFINEAGVPSIAEMSVELTDEINGVEVKFSVTNRNDYQSFRNEAHAVFTWFEQKPVITGVDNFTHNSVSYAEKNIVPGVHSRASVNNYNREPSVALMGNIAYPLNNIPDAEKNLGSVASLLECGLVLEFEIGDLDFAASREQLSYVPLTLNSIKKKLEELNANLANHLAAKADAIDNEWRRAFFLCSEFNNRLYKSAVEKYATDTKFPLFDPKGYYGIKIFALQSEDLRNRGLEIGVFRSSAGSSNKMTEHSDYVKNSAGTTSYVKSWHVPVDKSVVLVLNDLKTGCMSRARYHFNKDRNSHQVYCISHNSPDLAVRQAEYDKLIAELHNPPVIIKASELEKQERVKPVSSQGIVYIRLKQGGRTGNSEAYAWEPYTETLDEKETYYYVTLNNHEPFDKNGNVINLFNIKAQMVECGIADISGIKILGVRKNRIKEIQDLDNWIWFEDKLKEETAKISDSHIKSLVIAEMLDSYYNRVYTNATVVKLVGPESDYAKFFNEYGNVKRVSGNVTQLVSLCGTYGKSVQVDVIKKKIEDAKNALYKKYPLLKIMRNDSGDIKPQEVAHYISLVDKQEKI